MSTIKYDIQVIISSGLRDFEKATAGFAMALACATAGAKVAIFLIMQGAVFVDPREGKISYVNGFLPIREYIQLLHKLGARIEVCAACAHNFCSSENQLPININTDEHKHNEFFYIGITSVAIRGIQVETIMF